ncbi:MAG: hypothetical protein P4L34_09825 [Paludibacter sp.]|nr:hypothetical protein [Paludibacter sp.]
MTNKFQNKYRIPSARWRDWNYADEGAYFVTICTKNRLHFFGKVVEGEMQLSEIGKIVEHEWLKSPSLRPDMNLDMEILQIMPNHIHGIIVIGQNEYNSANSDRDVMHDDNCRDIMHDDNCRDVMHDDNCRDAMHDDNCRDAMHDDNCRDAMHDDNCRDAMHCVSTNNDDNRDAIGVNRDAKHGVSTNNDIDIMIEQNLPANHFGPQSKNLASILRGFKSAVTIETHKIQPHFIWQERFYDRVIRDDAEFRRIAYYIYENPANWTNDLYNQEQ